MKRISPSPWLEVMAGTTVAFLYFWDWAWAAFETRTLWITGLIIAILLLMPLWRWTAKRRAVCIAAFVFPIILLPWLVWDTRKAMLQDFERVRVGMTEEEVTDIMGAWRTGTGWPAPPGNGGVADEKGELAAGTVHLLGGSGTIELGAKTVIYRHTNEGWGNSDWAIVEYNDSRRVIRKEFSHD